MVLFAIWYCSVNILDGVVYHGNSIIPGVKSFVQWLLSSKKKFLFLTNNSAPTPRELSLKMHRLGIDVDESHFYTSALATAKFLKSQKPDGGTCYVIGEAGLTYALYENGFIMNDNNPDYVVIGEGNSHNFEKITKACNLVIRGAKLIGTNPDVNGPIENGIAPACGAFIAAIELATGKKAFYCGKPSSLMMRYAQASLGTEKEETCIIGDRMDTDILAGTLAQIDPILVMSGVTNRNNIFQEAYRPYITLSTVGDIVPHEI
jgi:NagD protein